MHGPVSVPEEKNVTARTRGESGAEEDTPVPRGDSILCCPCSFVPATLSLPLWLCALCKLFGRFPAPPPPPPPTPPAPPPPPPSIGVRFVAAMAFAIDALRPPTAPPNDARRCPLRRLVRRPLPPSRAFLPIDTVFPMNTSC